MFRCLAAPTQTSLLAWPKYTPATHASNTMPTKGQIRAQLKRSHSASSTMLARCCKCNRSWQIQQYHWNITCLHSYDGAGFLEKNKDELFPNLADLMASASNDFVATVLFPGGSGAGSGEGSASSSPSASPSPSKPSPSPGKLLVNIAHVANSSYTY